MAGCPSGRRQNSWVGGQQQVWVRGVRPRGLQALAEDREVRMGDGQGKHLEARLQSRVGSGGGSDTV